MDIQTLKAAIAGTRRTRHEVLNNLTKRELCYLIESAWRAANPGKPLCCYIATSERRLRNTKGVLIRQLCYWLDKVA
jgi:hypothetical protein